MIYNRFRSHLRNIICDAKRIGLIRSIYYKVVRRISNEKYNECMVKKLTKDYNECIKRAKSWENKVGSINRVIWTLWWQGEENMPILVKNCYDSICKSSKNIAEVILITESNLSEYVNLPQNIIDKFASGNISIIHFSDIIRIYLLANYGGMWIDTTTFISDIIDSEIFNMDLWYQKYPIKSYNCDNISKGRWSVFLLAGRAHSPLFEFALQALYTYWDKHKEQLDYFLTDFTFEVAYQKIPLIREQMDNIMPNNLGIHDLLKVLNNECDMKIFESICNTSKYHKLSRKVTIDYSIKNSYYSKIINT